MIYWNSPCESWFIVKSGKSINLKTCFNGFLFFKNDLHSVKSICIRSYSGLHFPTFRLNTERYSVSLRIQSKCWRIRTRITLNTDTCHAVLFTALTRGIISGIITINLQRESRKQSALFIKIFFILFLWFCFHNLK